MTVGTDDREVVQRGVADTGGERLYVVALRKATAQFPITLGEVEPAGLTREYSGSFENLRELGAPDPKIALATEMKHESCVPLPSRRHGLHRRACPLSRR